MDVFKECNNWDLRYGIADVIPNRAIKKCKIVKLRIEYFLSDNAILLVSPKPCALCDRISDCLDDFVDQIVKKYNDRHKGSDTYYLL